MTTTPDDDPVSLSPLMNPTTDLCQALVDHMRHAIIEALPLDQTEGLDQTSLHELQIIFGNWQNRLIPPRPRTVHRPLGFDDQPSIVPYAAELDVIVAKIEAGDDLTPHLSERVATARVEPVNALGKAVKMHRRDDLDLMLAAWGIHHLHLSGSTEPNGFVTRAGSLLFAVFTPNDAYFIGVYDHNSWARQELLTVIIDNWPDTGIVWVMKGASVEIDVTDEELLELRKGGVNTIVNVNGIAAIPGTMTLAGTPFPVTEHANTTARAIYELDRAITEQGIVALDNRCEIPAGEPSQWHPASEDHPAGTRTGFRDVNAEAGRRFVGVAWLSTPR